MRWEVRPNGNLWQLRNMTTGRIVVEAQRFEKCHHIKQQLEANLIKREDSMGRVKTVYSEEKAGA